MLIVTNGSTCVYVFNSSFVYTFQVYEAVPCHSDCSQYKGVTDPWSVCKVTNVDLRENCGEGVQTRKVR